ncbi:MAG: flagellar FliJ protein [Halioglobus sp.]
MKTGKMDKVAAVAKIAEQLSARELGQARQSHQEKSAKLEQLIQFRSDYEAGLGAKGGQGMPAKQLQDYRIFLSKLSDAIAQQTREVDASDEQLGKVRAQWRSKSQRKSALDHLVEERHKSELQAKDKAEQKESDENTMARRMLNLDRG